MKKFTLSLVILVCSLMVMNHSLGNYASENQELFEGKTILVIGGTGYLGQAIIDEVAKYSPKCIYVLSRDEVKHFNLISAYSSKVPLYSIIGDIRDYQCMLSSTKGVDIVFHVAALKRMDALESNVTESIKTNILGSYNIFNACVENNVKKVLFVSTDKACLPINTYGASKFISEKIFTNYDYARVKTVFVAVRFGNIIESTGSVIPIFSDKIKKNQDIPITDPNMTRFIINKREAVDLMMDALRYAVGGEIFVRKISAMKIIDLAHALKNVYEAKSRVKIVGIRPGEKIHEVLVSQSEMARAYEFQGNIIIVPNLKEWRDNGSLPAYIQRGVKSQVAEYSSDQAVILQHELEQYLHDFWVSSGHN